MTAEFEDRQQEFLLFIEDHTARLRNLYREKQERSERLDIRDFLVVVVKPGHERYLKIGQQVVGPYAGGGWGGVTVRYPDGSRENYAWTREFDGLPRGDWREIYKPLLADGEIAFLLRVDPGVAEFFERSSKS